MSFIGKEKEIESELSDFGVRKYDNEIGRFTSIDPLWEKYYSWTPYHYCSNNPVMGSDGSGLSTFTYEDGSVTKVTEDDDYNIYKTSLVKGTYEEGKTNVTKEDSEIMGQTYFWDEFVNPEKGTVFGKIDFGKSWEGLIKSKHEEANSYILGDISVAYESLPGGSLDIKVQTEKYSMDKNYNKGKLIGDYYFSGRSAGNYLAGWNGSETLLSKSQYMSIAGLLHGSGGEIPYTTRMVYLGWNNKDWFTLLGK